MTNTSQTHTIAVTIYQPDQRVHILCPRVHSSLFTPPVEAQADTVHQIQTYSKTRNLEIIHKLTAKSLPVCKLSKQDHTPKSSNPHIRPLWISQSQNFPVQQIDCEVDTGAGCDTLPAYKAGTLLRTRMTKLSPTTNGLHQIIWG